MSCDNRWESNRHVWECNQTGTEFLRGFNSNIEMLIKRSSNQIFKYAYPLSAELKLITNTSSIENCIHTMYRRDFRSTSKWHNNHMGLMAQEMMGLNLNFFVHTLERYDSDLVGASFDKRPDPFNKLSFYSCIDGRMLSRSCDGHRLLYKLCDMDMLISPKKYKQYFTSILQNINEIEGGTDEEKEDLKSVMEMVIALWLDQQEGRRDDRKKYSEDTRNRMISAIYKFLESDRTPDVNKKHLLGYFKNTVNMVPKGCGLNDNDGELLRRTIFDNCCSENDKSKQDENICNEELLFLIAQHYMIGETTLTNVDPLPVKWFGPCQYAYPDSSTEGLKMVVEVPAGVFKALESVKGVSGWKEQDQAQFGKLVTDKLKKHTNRRARSPSRGNITQGLYRKLQSEDGDAGLQQIFQKGTASGATPAMSV